MPGRRAGHKRYEPRPGGEDQGRRIREDLFYRLNVVVMSIPPLRERKADIPLLTEHFLKRYARENGKEIDGLSREAKDLLLKYDYPGKCQGA